MGVTGGIASTRLSRVGVPLLTLATVVAVTMPWWADASWLRLFTEFACFLVLAQMWNLLAGYGGLISVGQQAYLGIGGYTLFALADYGGMDPFLAIPVAGLAAALLAVPLGRVVFRLQGGYFAIGTWVIAETCRLAASNIAPLGGGSGRSLTAIRATPRALRESVTFWIALAAVIASVGLVYLLLRSRFGLALTAMRDSDIASESQGVDVAATRFWVYLASAFGCGIAGALYFLSILRISPEAAFSVNWTAYLIFIVVVGGIGRLEGPLIGTLVFFLMREFLADFSTWYLIALGAVAIVVMLVAPEGIWGTLTRRYELQLFPLRRRLFDTAAAPQGPPK